MIRTTASRHSHRTAAAFQQYVTGRRTDVAGAVFFLEASDHLDAVCRIAARGDVVVAPSPADPRGGATGAGGVPVVGYSGSWREPGDEIRLDGRHTFALQDYVALPFLSITGRVVVRQRTAKGIAAFLGDADTARYFGVLVSPLLSSAVMLDSGASFGRPRSADDALARVHVTADGEYRDGADGLLLGRVGDARSEIEKTGAADGGRGRGFARIVDRELLEAELDRRPWFESYLAAIGVLRRGSLPARSIDLLASEPGRV
ncbi:hypothetical protein [Microbacterium sp. SA39]|uniref:hypothetical protein n=1 Tax=Microbacterium sp. SA39 TaxID=1263625 RepID=UPI00126A6C1C|nr:hypothetical protein [Microbacterium sp. SA39]